MNREESHPRVVVEDRLCAVTVMDVPVDDQHALRASVEGGLRGDGDVIEQAEAHRAPGERVVAGRTDEA